MSDINGTGWAVAAAGGRRILIVEDEFLIAMELQSVVVRLGGTVIGPFVRLADALAGLAAERPDAALLDIRLQEGTTAPVAEALFARQIPFLVLSGWDRSSLAEPVLLQAPFLSKPAIERDLAAALERLFAEDGDGGGVDSAPVGARRGTGPGHVRAGYQASRPALPGIPGPCAAEAPP